MPKYCKKDVTTRTPGQCKSEKAEREGSDVYVSEVASPAVMFRRSCCLNPIRPMLKCWSNKGHVSPSTVLASNIPLGEILMLFDCKLPVIMYRAYGIDLEETQW